MEVLLTKDVENVGNAGEIKSVANGYARNYLIPRGLAVVATAGARRQAEQIRKAGEARRQKAQRAAQSLAERIAGLELRFKMRAGENDKLYGSVTATDIAEKISEAIGEEIDKRRLQLDHSLRELGIYQVGVKLLGDIVPEVTVKVEPEGEVENSETPPAVETE